MSSQLRTRNRLLELRRNVVDAANAFLDRAEEPGALEQVMPGYTHFQHAQPISVAFWISHYAAALSRDLSRLSHAYNSVDAIRWVVVRFPERRSRSIVSHHKTFGIPKSETSPLDATGHRDWMCEVRTSHAFHNLLSSRGGAHHVEQLRVQNGHVGRWICHGIEYDAAEEESWRDRASSWSSRNSLGLRRCWSFDVTDCLLDTTVVPRERASVCVLYVVIVLSLIISFYELLKTQISGTMAIRASGIVAPVVSSTQFNLERMEELCDKNFMTATELANWLVKEHDVPFRETHHVVGSLVGAMVKQGKDLTYLDDVVKHLNDTCGLNTSKEEIKPVLTPKDVMLSYNSFGGTGPEVSKDTIPELRDETNHWRSDG